MVRGTEKGATLADLGLGAGVPAESGQGRQDLGRAEPGASEGGHSGAVFGGLGAQLGPWHSLGLALGRWRVSDSWTGPRCRGVSTGMLRVRRVPASRCLQKRLDLCLLREEPLVLPHSAHEETEVTQPRSSSRS